MRLFIPAKFVLPLLLAAVAVIGAGCDRNPPAAPEIVKAAGPTNSLSTAEREWLDRAEQGDAEAQFRLGLLYLSGFETPTDPEMATARFRAAASSFLTNNSHHASGSAPAPDAAKALTWLLRSAEQGHQWAQPLLGDLYRTGRGTATNITEAIKWYKTSAENGNQWSAYELAMIYSEGRGGQPKDLVEGLKWYHQAAEAGIVWAQYELGALYDKSKDIPRDPGQAARWYGQAAQQGHDWAEYSLAYLYYTGRGVDKDYAKALLWFQRAAEQGNFEAQYMTGYLLGEGRGCERNNFEAGKWLYLAVEGQGKPHHHEYWLMVRARLTEKELTEIRLHAAQFKPKKKTG